MRCPNLECRQVFTVQAMEAQGPAPELPPPPPSPQTKVVVKPKPPVSKPTKPKPAAKSVEAEEVVDAVIVEAEIISKPKEVVWSEGTDVPPKDGRKGLKAEVMDEDLPVRKKRRNLAPYILIFLGIATVGGLVAVLMYVGFVAGRNEEKLAKQAKEQYEKGDYNDATKSFEKLTTEYPDSRKIDEYKFFRDLSQMQTVVRSVTTRENYDAAVKRFREFIEANKDSPFAKPKSGYGRDILESGKKLSEDIATFSQDRVKTFQGDRANKSGELNLADKAIADGRELLPILEPYRSDEDLPLDKQRTAFDNAEKAVKRERDRTAAINSAKAKLVDPSDSVIQVVVSDLQAAGFLDDIEAQSLIAEAKGRLRDLVKYEDDPAARQEPPPTVASSLLFVTPLGETKFREPVAGETPTVYLCVARGILYAIEDDTGTLLWATRVGPDVTDPPAVARVQLATGLTDVAVVTSNVGNTPAVSGYLLRSGKAEWYQPLPAPAAGPAIVMGTRAFVPVRDAQGTVYEFDLKTGDRVGRIRLGQPVADRGATIRPGTSLLYVAADARRLYVIDVGGKDDDGNRVNPRCLQVIATGHLPGTLRVAPLFVGPEGVEPAERWMVLAQADSPARTQLRAFSMKEPPPAPVDGVKVPETPAVPDVTVPIDGWVSFAPVSDGEQLAVITDTGHFRLFGVKQAGNLDKPLYPLPSPDQPVDRPVPGLVVPLEESTYWLLAGGQLQKARLALLPSKGQEIVRVGAPKPIGEPIHRAQINSRKDVACVVVRSMNSSGCRAVAFGLRDGEIRWQRQLGLVPAKMSADQFAAPVAQGERLILVDEDGSVVAVPTSGNIGAGQTLAALPGWRLDSPPQNATGPTLVVASVDGKSVFTVTPVNREAPKFLIRRIANGKIVSRDEVNAPEKLAGQPAVIGDHLLIPTADGFVHRFVPGNGDRNASITAGPSWWVERRGPNAACSITPLSVSAFATSDGGKKLSRWDWPAALDAKWNPAGVWELEQNVAGPGIVLPPVEANSPPRLIVADTSGSVRLFAADRAGPHLRRWRPDGKNVIPLGKPSSNFAVQTTDPSRTVVTYVVDGKSAVAINPEQEDPLWATRPIEDASSIVGAPQSAGANRWVITDLAGRVLVLDGDTGEVLATQTVGLPGAVPAAASGIAATKALTPLSDGSAAVIELPKPAPLPKKE